MRRSTTPRSRAPGGRPPPASSNLTRPHIQRHTSVQFTSTLPQRVRKTTSVRPHSPRLKIDSGHAPARRFGLPPCVARRPWWRSQFARASKGGSLPKNPSPLPKAPAPARPPTARRSPRQRVPPPACPAPRCLPPRARLALSYATPLACARWRPFPRARPFPKTPKPLASRPPARWR